MFRLSTHSHGVLDYFVSAALTALPHALNCGKPAAGLLRAAGVGAGIYSMMTDYERGLIKVLPMKAHLTLDALSGATLIAASLLLDEERPEVRAAMAGIGAFEIAAAAMTSQDAYENGESPSPAERIAAYV